MKRSLSIVLAACSALLALPAHADLARSFSSATYTGVGVSQLDSDFQNLGKGYNLDAIGGYWITPELGWGRVAAELNLSVTVAPGKNAGQPQSDNSSPGGLFGGGTSTTTTSSGKTTSSSNDLSVYALALQAVYHTPGRIYGIGTVGFGLTNTSIQEIQDKGSTHVLFGGGVGFRFGANTAAVEVLYTKINQDLQTIGLRLSY
jgi:hypothetical protein